MSRRPCAFRRSDLIAALKAVIAAGPGTVPIPFAGATVKSDFEEFLAGQLTPVEFKAIRRPVRADNTDSQG